MTAKKKAKAAGPKGSAVAVGDAHRDAEEVKRRKERIDQEKAWRMAAAATIERGVLPDDPIERQMIAALLRDTCRFLKVAPPRRGPGQPPKITSPDDAALAVWFRVKAGQSLTAAAAEVAEGYDADGSTLEKLYREREPGFEALLERGSGNPRGRVLFAKAKKPGA